MKTFDLRSRPDLEIPRPGGGGDPPGALDAVRAIIERVRAEGDAALLDLTKQFDGAGLSSAGLRVSADEIEDAARRAGAELTAALREMAARIRAFAERQKIEPWRAEIGGAAVGEDVHPIERAGIYVPGGRASYPSTVLMCAVPARVAGVEEVALCVPPGADGTVAISTLAAAAVAGVSEVYRVGGAQAIAALAFGTETIRRAGVIVGPGNIYVALAKREVAGFVAIDSIAGPSEIAIVADGSADSSVIAADLVAQAEHGPGGSFLLVTWDEGLAKRVEAETAARLDEIGASTELRATLEEGARLVIVKGLDAALEAADGFAPEHVELIFDGAEQAASRLRHAGAVFVGPYSPVSLGDYLAGSNHVLPTAGAARWACGLRTSHFQRTSAIISYDEGALRKAAPFIDVIAEAEGLPNHARAVKARFSQS
jgi:histidinol dehydrogenase